MAREKMIVLVEYESFLFIIPLFPIRDLGHRRTPTFLTKNEKVHVHFFYYDSVPYILMVLVNPYN